MTINFDKRYMVLIASHKAQRTNVLSSSYSSGKISNIRIYKYEKTTKNGVKIENIVARIGNSGKVHSLFSYSDKHEKLMFGERIQMWEIIK